MYVINGIEYTLKEKYSLKDWGKIFKTINASSTTNTNDTIINLLEDNKIVDLMNLILDVKENVIGDIYEEDFETVTRVINDFFSRNTSLIKNIQSSLKN